MTNEPTMDTRSIVAVHNQYANLDPLSRVSVGFLAFAVMLNNRAMALYTRKPDPPGPSR